MAEKTGSFVRGGNQSPFANSSTSPAKATDDGKKAGKAPKEKRTKLDEHRGRSYAQVHADVQAMIYRDSGGKCGRPRKKRSK